MPSHYACVSAVQIELEAFILEFCRDCIASPRILKLFPIPARELILTLQFSNKLWKINPFPGSPAGRAWERGYENYRLFFIFIYFLFMRANTMHCPCDRMHDSCEYTELALCNLRSHYAYFSGLATYLCYCVTVQSVWLNMFSQMLWSSSNKILNNVLWNAYSVQIAYYITLTVMCSDRCWAL